MLLIACIILGQRMLLETTSFELYELPFASSFGIYQSPMSNLLFSLYIFAPIPFILLEFSGIVGELTKGYGKVWIIRAYKKSRLYLKTIGVCAGKLLFIVLYQTLVFLPFDGKWQPLSGMKKCTVIMTYFLGVLAIVLLQAFFEFWVDVSYANVICNLFFAVSLLTGGTLLSQKSTEWLGIVLFPNMMFGKRNGIIPEELINIESQYVFVYLGTIIFAVVCLSIIRFQKKDVF